MYINKKESALLENVAEEILSESGVNKIKELAKKFKTAVIYAHIDMDGLYSAIAMKEYLKRYGIMVKSVIPIQYGNLEYEQVKPDLDDLKVLVDFAHGKDVMDIHTDHHASQIGVDDKTSTHFAKARSNAVSISAKISPSPIFPQKDVDVINMIDSADFARYNISVDDVAEIMWKLDQKHPHLKLGIALNNILMANKNKYNFFSNLAMQSNPSTISIYLTAKKLLIQNKKILDEFEMNNEVDEELTLAIIGDMLVQRELNPNKPPRVKPHFSYKSLEATLKGNTDYIEEQKKKAERAKGKKVTELKDGEAVLIDGIIAQNGGGTMFKGYFRYTPFKVFPEADYLCILWPMGLIQTSANPFRKEGSVVNLLDIHNEVLAKHRKTLEELKLPVGLMKYGFERDSSEDSFGFTYKDLMGLFGKVLTIKEQDLEEFKTQMDKLTIKTKKGEKPSPEYKKQKDALNKYSISMWDIIQAQSGGHKSIANISGLSFLTFFNPKTPEGEKKDPDEKTPSKIFMQQLQADIVERMKGVKLVAEEDIDDGHNFLVEE